MPSREGHTAVRLDNLLLLTGGFSNDTNCYFLRLPDAPNGVAVLDADAEGDGQWLAVAPEVDAFHAYGASLTALPAQEKRDAEGKTHRVRRAVRLGGFRVGGYSAASNAIALLEVDDDGGEQGPRCAWQVIDRGEEMSGNNMPRAYHSATLLLDRFLLVIGGMSDAGPVPQSILAPAVLDCSSWQWLDVDLDSASGEKPSGRHGHSVIVDEPRRRVLLVGGGSGADLLRSGRDDYQVWELAGIDFSSPTALLESMPWSWRRLEHLQPPHLEMDQRGPDDVDRRVIGRCHFSFHLLNGKSDTVLFFGGGRVSTNRIHRLHLDTESWSTPQVAGPLPPGRFTGVQAMNQYGDVLFIHGGFSSDSGSLGDLYVLDLAPSLNRSLASVSAVNEQAESAPDAFLDPLQAHSTSTERGRSGALDPRIFGILTQIAAQDDPAQRQHIARQLLAAVPGNPFLHMLVQGIVDGNMAVQLADDDEEESDEGEDDEWVDDDS